MGQEILKTNEIRENQKGRHTTTHRQLLLVPSGGVVIDTPGMRELHLQTGDLSKSFQDIEELAKMCRYRNCSHVKEPGCEVRAAIEAGRLSVERLENYFKLQKEMNYEGLNSRELEREKIKNMFGSTGQMKQAMRYIKNKKK